MFEVSPASGDGYIWHVNYMSFEDIREYFSSDTTAVIAPADNSVYSFETLTSLTVSAYDPTRVPNKFTIKFDSGATPTVTTFPSTIHGLESFAAEANTHYEIDVENEYAVVGKWAVSST